MAEPNVQKPIFGFISDRTIGVIGIIIGIVVSTFFYLNSIAEPQLTFVANPARTTILTTGQTSRLKVYFDEDEIAKDLSAAQIVVWNAGRKVILSSDVLEPIVLRTSDGSKILEANVTRTTRKVTKLNTSALPNRIDAVQLNFNLLEQDDGAEIQVIYQGNRDVQFVVEGQLIGQRFIQDSTDMNTQDTSRGKFLVERGFHKLFGIMILLGALTVGGIRILQNVGMIAPNVKDRAAEKAKEKAKEMAKKVPMPKWLVDIFFFVGVCFALYISVRLLFFVPNVPQF